MQIPRKKRGTGGTYDKLKETWARLGKDLVKLKGVCNDKVIIQHNLVSCCLLNYM